MKMKFLMFLVLLIQLSSLKTMASDEHAHGKEDSHQHEDEDHGSEVNSAVGPDKGIREKNENGFKISPEATMAFDFKVQSLTGKITEIPRAALVDIKNDQFVYRLREGWLKRLKMKILTKNKQKLTIELSDYKEGDQIVVSAVGFVRTAEMVAEEGVAHGHSH